MNLKDFQKINIRNFLGKMFYSTIFKIENILEEETKVLSARVKVWLYKTESVTKKYLLPL